MNQAQRKSLEAMTEPLETIKAAIEEITEEAQCALDNVPDNLKEGRNAYRMQEVIDNLETIAGNIEYAISTLNETVEL